uniref:GDNF-inducible zinc finger protein 1 n=1 Tax=Cacopsylla melanoneura TaxID=428564 RepID=A0A8D9DWP6_9HEMI
MSTATQTVEVVTLNTFDDEHNENSCASMPQDAEKTQSQTMISNSNTERMVSSTKKVFFIPLGAKNQRVSPDTLKVNPGSSSARKTLLESSRPVAESTNRTTLLSVTNRPLPSPVEYSQPLKDRPFECEICFKRFSQKQTLRTHILTHTGQRPFPCKICDKSFTQVGALTRHVALHTNGEKEFSCHLCTQSFRQLNNLKRHMNLHAPDAASSFKCEICLRQFARKDGLERHAKRHLSKREMFYCGICEKSFASPVTHARHEQNHRKNGEEKATCRNCRGGFVRKRTIRNQTAPSNKEFTPSCSEKGPSSNDFSSSTSEKTLAENLCPSCKSKPSERNVLIHSCGICRMEFPSKAKLRTHTELAHIDKVNNFSCNICDRSFVTRSHFENHCLVHRNETGLMPNLNVYQCNYCNLLFTNREGIIRHMRWHEKKLQENVVKEKEKGSQNDLLEPDFRSEEMEDDFGNEKKKESRNEHLEADFHTEEMGDDSVNENLYLHVSKEEIEYDSYSEEILCESQDEDSKDSNPLKKNETTKENDFEGELVEDYLIPNHETHGLPNEFNIVNNEKRRCQINILDDTSNEENNSLRFGSGQMKLIKVTPMEQYVQENNEAILEEYSIDPLAITTKKNEEEGYIEDTINAQYESIETIHDHNGSCSDYRNEPFTIKLESDETSEVGSELIRSETFTDDLGDTNSVKSMNTFTEISKNSVASMSILTDISSLPKDISFANLPKDIRDMLHFDGSNQTDVSSDEKCKQSNEISTSTSVYPMKKSKESTLSNELIDEMITDLLNMEDTNGKSKNGLINVVYEDDKPIGIVYENDETIEVIQHVEDSTVKEEYDIKYAPTIRDTKELEENRVDTMHNAESVMSGDETVEIKHEVHESDIEIHYNELEDLQPSEAGDNEKIRVPKIEDETAAEETDTVGQDSERKFVLLEVPDKDLMFLLDERTTSAPNSPRDIDDEFEHFNETIDEKTNETTTREKDANDSIPEEMTFESIGNVKLKKPPRNLKHTNIEVPDEMMYHLRKVNFKKPPIDSKTSPNKFQTDLCAKKNSQIKKPMLKSDKKFENLTDQIVEEEYVYILDPSEKETIGESSHFCYVCKKSYTNKNSLKRHFRTTHTNYQKFSCSLCHKTFKAKDALQKHIRSLHAPHRFKCSACPKTFNRKDALASHARLHVDEKPFGCDICGARFAQNQNLYAHKLKHRDKSHLCQYCDKSFYTKQLRDKHHLTHTNKRSFQCATCKMTFKQKNHLQMHYLVHGDGNERSYKCNDCAAIFNRKGSLQRHTAIHLVDAREKYFCEHCGKGVTHRITLERHLKNKVCAKRMITPRGKTKDS